MNGIPALARVAWKPGWRIIPSRFPPIPLFERIADPADFEALIEIESLTNPRLRDEVGDIRLVPAEDRISGPGSSIVMAAFTHLNPDGSRFSDGTYGVFYAALDLETAVAETVYHAEKFMMATREPRQELDRRVYLMDLDLMAHDIRGDGDRYSLAYHETDYSHGQSLARTLREAGSDGIAYRSVRRANGECAAVFRPRLVTNCRQERHLRYIWDGRRIAEVYERRTLTGHSEPSQ